MTRETPNIAGDRRADTACVRSVSAPDFRPAALLSEGRDMFRFSGERPNPVGSDGRLSFPNLFGGDQAGRCGDRPVPPVRQGADNTFEGRASALLSKDTTDEQKLATVREMAKAGITGLTFKDASGQEHKLRLELEAAGSRQMVHLFVTGADGRERTALRGISRADGSFEHERDRSGNFVSYEGRGYSQLTGSDQSDGNPDRRPPDRVVGPEGRRLPQQPWQFPHVMDGSIDRSQFESQLRDPRVMAAFAGRMHTEVGNQGPAAQLAFAEEVMNRAASRGQTLMQALSGRYYPTPHPGFSRNPQYYAAIIKAWHEGTDTTHGATGNASGRVGFGGGPMTARIGGEKFGIEQVDLSRGWRDKYRELKSRGSVASRERVVQPVSPFESGVRTGYDI